MRESKAQLEEADQKRNCPSLVEKVTFKAKIMKQTNNKTLTIDPCRDIHLIIDAD